MNRLIFLLVIYLTFFMTRVTRGFVARRRRKKILATVRGCRAGRSRLFRVANQQSIKSRFYMYSGRKRLKRARRQLWIKRINASVRSNSQLTYNTFIYGLT
jgi:large subunit ribosomal protein L20